MSTEIIEEKEITGQKKADSSLGVLSLKGKKFFLETYGCQMNVSDSEIVTSLLQSQGYQSTNIESEADVILMNTCAIRENAEQRVRQRLTEFKSMKKENPNMLIGVLGCMAERLKTKLIQEENLVDLVVGPDAYRSLPYMLATVKSRKSKVVSQNASPTAYDLRLTTQAVNVLLSREETYDDITPVRLLSPNPTSGENGIGVTAFISIMRGCDNMCSFCVVPFTRGRERSRDPETIVNEAKALFETGYREVTLLGQNVDSYKFSRKSSVVSHKSLVVEGQSVNDTEDLRLTTYNSSTTVDFASLLAMVAEVSPLLRVRFSTSNPQDMTDKVVDTIAKYPNICNYIHLPVQSGSSRMLKLMNRGYDRETYLKRIEYIRNIIPDCGLSTDIIAGFCSETEEEHRETVSLIEKVKFDYSYTFMYSERPGTPAAKKFKDDIADEVKAKRVQEIIALQRQHSLQGNKADIGKTFEVLVEGHSKRSKEHVFGRNTQNKAIVFESNKHKPGDYVHVLVTNCTSGTLIGELQFDDLVI